MTSMTHLRCTVHGTTLCDHATDAVAAVTDPEVGRLDRRRVRMAAQSVLWRVSTLKRVRHCGRYLSQTASGVQLRVTATDAGRRAGFAGLQTCGSVWACPCCSAKILAARQTEIQTAVDRWLERDPGAGVWDGKPVGGRVAMATLTVRHHAHQSIADVWDAVSTGWTGVTTGRQWQDAKQRYGLGVMRKIKSGPRAGEERATHVLPWLRVTEVTHGDNGWHVHLHVVLFLPAHVDEDGLADLYDGMWSRWNAALVAGGFDGGLKVNRAAFLSGREVSKRVSEYVTKNTYTDPGTAAGLEVARADLKDGRFGNRSAMGILRDLVMQPEGSDPERDARLWAQYEQGSSGRRQMTWAVGARDLLGLEDERSDEDLAAEEQGTADDSVAVIPGDSWATLLAQPRRRADLLDASERSTPEALGLLVAWGIDHDVTTRADLERARAHRRIARPTPSR